MAQGQQIDWWNHLAAHLHEAADMSREAGADPEVMENFTRAAVEATGVAAALAEAFGEFEVYLGDDGRHWWKVTATDGSIAGKSQRGFDDEQDAFRDAAMLASAFSARSVVSQFRKTDAH